MKSDLDKFSIGDFFIKMEKLNKKTKIGFLYSSLDCLKEKRNKLYNAFNNKNTPALSVGRIIMSPQDYIELILISSCIKEIDLYIQKIDSYLDELLK